MINTSLRDDKKEILTILQDKQVIKSLTEFIGCNQSDLEKALKLRLNDQTTADVELRGSINSENVQNGYYNFTVPKNNHSGEWRDLAAPAQQLKTVQSSLLDTLRKHTIIAKAAAGGEEGSSPIKNALPHRQSSYTHTLDIKSAYPSVSAKRVNKNLMGALSRYFDFSLPHFSQEQRENFINILTTLITVSDGLPQGAPTSARILNIVLAKTDSEISTYLNGEDSVVQNSQYTRYIDDMTVSFQKFKEVSQNASKLKDAIDSADSLTGQTSIVDNYYVDRIKELDQKLRIYLGQSITIPNNNVRSGIRNAHTTMRDKLNQVKYMVQDNSELSEMLYVLIGDLDQHTSNLNTLDESKVGSLFIDSIKSIISKNGWELNHKKEKYRGPESSTAREITGIMIGKDGRLGISQEKMRNYVNLAKLAYNNPSQLDKKYIKDDNTVDEVQLAYVLNGVRNFIISVRGKSTGDFEDWYNGCKIKYFPNIPSHNNHKVFGGGSMGGF